MNTFETVVVCIVASTFLQGLGFYLYSFFYKRKFLQKYYAETNAGMPGEHKTNAEPLNKVKQDSGMKPLGMANAYNINIFERTTIANRPNKQDPAFHFPEIFQDKKH